MFIDVEIKGFTIYCENERHERYDFFVPKQDYRISKREMLEHVPENHKILDSKRTTKTLNVNYDELKQISK